MTDKEARELLAEASRRSIGEFMDAMVEIARQGGTLPIVEGAGPYEWLWAQRVASALDALGGKKQ